MDDSDNPFLPPASDETAPAPTPVPADWDDDVDPRTIGKARHVPWVAILLIVHGVLMFVAAAGLVGIMVFVMPQMGEQFEKQQQMQRQQNPNAPQLTKEGMTTLLSAVYGGIGACLFLIGVLNIYAGIRNYSYHNRILGVISLILNMGSIFFCWCLPLSIGLLIYGIVIYLSPEAERAFRWRSETA